jgi:phospholipid/cholesterol/gamma-HCH transport system substrate-binding protein
MRRNLIETVMGAVVLLVAALFVYFAYNTAQVRSAPGYPITASFGKVGGLSVGSDVRISGIKVGSVAARALDLQSYEAVVSMSIDDGVKLPEDTIASIASEGPLGGRYVRLEPGTSSTALQPGGTIKETRGYRSLEDQVGEIIFLATGKPGAQTQ